MQEIWDDIKLEFIPNYLRIQLIGIADVDENRGMPVAKRYGCKSYKDYREMLTREKLDAVSIVVPLYLHERIALHRQRSFNFY